MGRQHERREMPMGGGMMRLTKDELGAAPLDGLARLACWMGLVVMGPHASDGAHRHALVTAIMRAEANAAKAPRVRRYEKRMK